MRLVGDRRVFSVEDVTARLSGMFEGLKSFWVEAEVQDLRPARSQMRFTLRGEHVLDASMNGIVFDRLPHRPANGTMVQAYGRIEFWRQRGQISMRVEKLELAGDGLLPVGRANGEQRGQDLAVHELARACVLQGPAPIANDPKMRPVLEKMTPMGRIPGPADYAGAALFLATDDANHITTRRRRPVCDGTLSSLTPGPCGGL